MTWHADQVEGRPQGDKREALLAEREKLVFQIELLKMEPLKSKSQAAQLGRIEDLTNLAKKVTSIDKKLGRL
jgi:hypothetical protein